jgi:hypothetical protein
MCCSAVILLLTAIVVLVTSSPRRLVVLADPTALRARLAGIPPCGGRDEGSRCHCVRRSRGN